MALLSMVLNQDLVGGLHLCGDFGGGPFAGTSLKGGLISPHLMQITSLPSMLSIILARSLFQLSTGKWLSTGLHIKLLTDGLEAL